MLNIQRNYLVFWFCTVWKAEKTKPFDPASFVMLDSLAAGCSLLSVTFSDRSPASTNLSTCMTFIATNKSPWNVNQRWGKYRMKNINEFGPFWRIQYWFSERWKQTKAFTVFSFFRENNWVNQPLGNQSSSSFCFTLWIAGRKAIQYSTRQRSILRALTCGTSRPLNSKPSVCCNLTVYNRCDVQNTCTCMYLVATDVVYTFSSVCLT